MITIALFSHYRQVDYIIQQLLKQYFSIGITCLNGRRSHIKRIYNYSENTQWRSIQERNKIKGQLEKQQLRLIKPRIKRISERHLKSQAFQNIPCDLNEKIWDQLYEHQMQINDELANSINNLEQQYKMNKETKHQILDFNTLQLKQIQFNLQNLLINNENNKNIQNVIDQQDDKNQKIFDIINKQAQNT